MRLRFFATCVAILAMTVAGTALAQTGEIGGRVIYEGQPLPGVTVTASSPALQGQKTTVTNAQGDYIIKALPGGDYKIRFEIPAFTTLEYDVRISTSQPRTLDAVMYPEAMQEEIVVTGQYETVSSGTQGSETMEQSTLEKLPVARTIQEAVGLAAGTSATGPSGNVSISGAQSYENLYTLNGVVLNENLRGQPFNMYIEDAVLETTTMTSNMSAEYGRFSGGVVNMVTKSGGNEFSGSFRTSVTNESWNGETPLTTSQEDTNNYTYEATFGGYILRDRLWFFAAGRTFETDTTDFLVVPSDPSQNVPFDQSQSEDRWEGKLTASFGPSHRLMASYFDRAFDDINSYFFTPVDEKAIDPSRQLPITGLSASYNGVLSDNFFVEAMYSERDYAFQDSGGEDQRLGGSPVWDLLTSYGFNEHIFCGSCSDEERNNKNYLAKGSWFFSAAGTHDLVFGVDVFEDIRISDNWQSATGYIWGPFVPQNYDTPGNPLTVIEPFGGYIIWGAVLEGTQGANMKTQSAFVNDTWRMSDKLTLSAGLRYDQTKGSDAGGVDSVDDSRVSPRLSASYDLFGDGKLVLNAGASRYVMSVTQNAGDAGSAAGQPTWAGFFYNGPEIIAGTPEYPTNFDALTAMFDWFFNVYGGPTNTDLAAWYDIPGLSPKVSGSLSSPYGDEYTLGASFRLGNRGVLRADLVHREYGSFYMSEIVPGRQVEVPNTGGVMIDQGLYINDDDLLSREYDALQTRFDYRIGSRWALGGTYTYSKAEGNFDGENSGSGPVPGSLLEYAEYKDPSWNAPVGYLGVDQRHKARAWVVWDMIASTHHNLSLSLLQNFWSGTSYSASGSINTIQFVGAPSDLGYAGSPGNVTYFFSDRGAFRWDDVTRTDISLNYSFFLNLGGTQLELFLQPEVLNVFNEDAVVGGNTTVLTAVNRSYLEPFNPFAGETPVEGVNWEKGPSFGEPTSDASYQAPRTVRFSVGLRF
jgi:hypothetical protein